MKTDRDLQKDVMDELVLHNKSFKFYSLPYNKDYGNEEGTCG